MIISQIKKNYFTSKIRFSVSVNTLKFATVFTIVNLHTLRNIIEIPYLAVYALLLTMVIFDFIKFGQKNINNLRYAIPVIWISIVVFGFLISLNFISVAGSGNGLIRYLYAFPIFIALINYIENRRQFKVNIGFCVAYFAVAVLTLPMQFVTGPISWFPESSERAGLVRFSSLIGSLTSLGVIVGSYIILTELMKKRQIIMIVAMVSCSVASLSKAAIANVAIGIIIVLFLNSKHFFKTFLAACAIIIPLFLVYNSVEQISTRVNAVMQSFGINFGDKIASNYDNSVNDSALDRITKLPRDNYDHLSKLNTPLVYLTGAGFGMADTALVPKADSLAVMAHNQFAENITVFGWIFGTVFTCLMIAIAVILVRQYYFTKQIEYVVCFYAYFVFLVNSVFANGTTYQPSSASVLYISMFLAVSKGVINHEKS